MVVVVVVAVANDGKDSGKNNCISSGTLIEEGF